MTRTRRIILIIILAFIIYAVYTDPNLAASYVKDAFEIIAQAVRAVFQFFSSLLR